MIDLSSETLLAIFLIFCRIGASLIMMPGFSSVRVPANIRLFIALTTTLALSPILVDVVRASVVGAEPFAILAAIVAETLTGLLIGLLARLFFMALQTLTVAAAQSVGLGGMPGLPMDDDEPLPSVVTLFTLTATMLLFLTDLHWELLRGLVDSYEAIPPGTTFDVRLGLMEISDQIAAAFLLALRISSPFLVFSVVVNFAVGITNKLTPQIPVYFVATPFITAGGLLLLYFTIHEFMAAFFAVFAGFLRAN